MSSAAELLDDTKQDNIKALINLIKEHNLNPGHKKNLRKVLLILMNI